jgi:hypothetical protein
MSTSWVLNLILLNVGLTKNTAIVSGGRAMNSEQYRSQLAKTTDEHLRCEFLKLLAQEGRQHFMRQIAEENFSDPSTPKPA